MFLFIGIKGQDKTAVAGYIPRRPSAAGIDFVIAVRFAKTFALAMIVISVITERADRPIQSGIVAVELVTAERVLFDKVKWRIASRHFHDEIERAAWLRSVLQGGAAPNEFDPLHRIKNWRVMCFRKTELLVFDRHAVLEDLHELAPLRI